MFDATLVRGMGYYTGPIFEIQHGDATSSIAGGGRYDRMVGKFIGRDVPATGFSIGAWVCPITTTNRVPN